MDQSLIIRQLMSELNLEEWQVKNVVQLMDDGNTIPFIARYRKEMHGTLSDEVIRNLADRLAYLRSLMERKESVIGLIAEQGKLTDELKAQIEKAATLVEVEDLYRPYKQKRRTRATVAKEKGLEPLATALLEQQNTELPLVLAAQYVDPEKEVKTPQDALAGASDILAEVFADDAECRRELRARTQKKGILKSTAKDENAESVYEMYYDFSREVMKLQGHQVLAVDRGEAEKMLKVSIEAPVEDIEGYMIRHFLKQDTAEKSQKGKAACSDTAAESAPAKSPVVRSEEVVTATDAFLTSAVRDAYKRLIAPSIENEIRSDLTEKAQDKAIKVFEKNLTQLLMQPPIHGKRVLGFDPAFRTGCKLAAVDATGKVLTTDVIYPTSGEVRIPEARAKLIRLMAANRIELIALGNGTASRESEQFIADVLKDYNPAAERRGLPRVQYVIVSEAGASVYSASKLGTEEFPDYDVALRSAVSIARRLQDPLAELVKIEPKAIGVGQYQHDMDQKKLSGALGGVVEDCVNRVGVDVNTASPSLLSYISGISGPISKNIVAYRDENGPYKTRQDLLKVPKLGPKAFEQCAGFLRIPEGDEPLDNTAVHPESYDAARKMLVKMGYNYDELVSSGRLAAGMTLVPIQLKGMDEQAMAEEFGIGVPTLEDISVFLSRPGRDPRTDSPAPILRTDVLSMEDLKEGMILKGTVRNVIDFGAFVDIGVHQDGLVHVSQLSNRFVKHPLDVVKVGDIVEVKVLSVDLKKKRIGLTMRL